MPSALLAINSDAANLEQMAEHVRRKFGWVLNGEAFVDASVVHGHRAPESESGRTRFAIDVDLAAGPRRGGQHAVVDRVVVRKRRDADESFVAGASTGKNLDKDDVVVYGERRNRSTVGPNQIVLAPAFAVTLKSEVGIVRNDVAVNVLDALLHQLVGKFL